MMDAWGILSVPSYLGLISWFLSCFWIECEVHRTTFISYGIWFGILLYAYLIIRVLRLSSCWNIIIQNHYNPNKISFLLATIPNLPQLIFLKALHTNLTLCWFFFLFTLKQLLQMNIFWKGNIAKHKKMRKK